MRRLSWVTAALGAVAALAFVFQAVAKAEDLPRSPPGVPQLNIARPEGGTIHVMPTPQGAAAVQAYAASIGFAQGNMTYHGGPTMRPFVAVYPMFWDPASHKLQNGTSCLVQSNSCFSAPYGTALVQLSAWIQAHGLWGVMTQYNDTLNVPGQTSYIQGGGGLGGFAVDSNELPASGCNDIATPGNCITDAQLTAEIQKVMAANGWTGNPSGGGGPYTKFFPMFTPKGEGECSGAGPENCSYDTPSHQGFCAYHSFFSTSSLGIVIYGNEPYGSGQYCWADFDSGATPPSPNGDVNTDAAATAFSHELFESVTDPLPGSTPSPPYGSGWYFNNLAGEIGDLCAYHMGGPNYPFKGGTANQFLNGAFFLIQKEWSNAANNGAGGCVFYGP